ncbi:MAG: hypothetical protein ACOH18_03205 [Candidatus Saccharimonadaceae bacterium]
MSNKISRLAYFGAISVFIVSMFIQPWSQAVLADSKPSTTTEPATVSSDALPTVQINGVVWAQAIIGNTVYATGKFTTARPAGVALGGAGSVTRTNILAYDITTGNLNTSFVHSLGGTNAEGKAITVSPDKTKIFVGGKFTSVDGQSRSNVAAFNAKTGALLSGYSGTTGTVKSLAATNSTLYVGGSFSTVAGVTHKNLVAFTTSNGAMVSNWAPYTNAPVNALIMTPDNSKVVAGGPFTQLNGKTYRGSGAVNATTGAAVAWASSSSTYPIQNYDTASQSSSITNFSTDGTYIYISAFSYQAPQSTMWMEGTAAINPTNGAIVWLDDCHGDTYGSFPQNGVLYSVSHAHDCGGMAGFPEASNPNYNQFALAQTLKVSGTNGPSTMGYPNKQGIAKTTLLNWFPEFGRGSTTSAQQAGWTIIGNGTYIAVGGEFPTVSGKAQQGLVRFGPASVAPNKIGPTGYSGGVVKNGPVEGGSVVVSVNAAYDRDNSLLSYTFYRDSSTTALKTISLNSTFWNRPTIKFVDTNVPNGAHTYRVVVKDTFGNTLNGAPIAVTGCHQTLGSVNSLCPDEILDINQSLFSHNGKYQLTMQSDGNLVLYNASGALWYTNTAGKGFAKFRLQTDSNIGVFLYDRGTVVWNAGVSSPSPLGLVVQDDGNVVIYNTSLQAVWNSHTNQP